MKPPAPAFKRVMLRPKQPLRPPPLPLARLGVRREQLDSLIIRETRKQLAKQFAQRSTFTTAVHVWCDLHPRAAGMGDHHPIWHERQKLAGVA